MTTATILIKNKKEYSLFFTRHDGYRDSIIPNANKILKSKMNDKMKQLIKDLDLEKVKTEVEDIFSISHCYFIDVKEKIIIALK